jgi:hypothetical protein
MKRLYSIIFAFFVCGLVDAQNNVNDSNKSTVRFNLSADQESYKCSNSGCKNSFSAVNPSQVNSIDKGNAEYVVPVIYYMIDNAKDLVGLERKKACNNYNYRECNYYKVSEKTISENIEVDAAALEYEDISNPVNRVCFDVATEIVKNFLDSDSQASRSYNLRIKKDKQ